MRPVKSDISVISAKVPFGFVVLKGTSHELMDVNVVERVPCDILKGCGISDVLDEALLQLKAYLADSSFKFNLPLADLGTDFQRRVWDGMKAIPVGAVKAYGQLACELGSGPRAVAAACRANPFPIFVPCHRIVAANGLGGYAGARDGFNLSVKKWLLQHEGVACV